MGEPRGLHQDDALSSGTGRSQLIMLSCKHACCRSALYAFHIFRKRFDFEPLLNPNSFPACSLNSTNTDSGTRNWMGFMEASSGRTFSAITSGVTVADGGFPFNFARFVAIT